MAADDRPARRLAAPAARRAVRAVVALAGALLAACGGESATRDEAAVLGARPRGRGGPEADPGVRARQPRHPRRGAADPVDRRPREAAHGVRRPLHPGPRPARQHLDPGAGRARGPRAAGPAASPDRASTRGDFFPGIWATNEIDGEPYGVPWYVDTRVLFYRSDLLARAGVKRPPRSWEEWRNGMRSVKALPGGEHYAILLPTDEWAQPVVLALQAGRRPPARRRPPRRLQGAALPQGVRVLRLALRRAPRAAARQRAGGEPVPAVRRRLLRHGDHRAVEPRRVPPPPPCRPPGRLGDGAAPGGDRGRLPRRLARGRLEPRGLRRLARTRTRRFASSSS